MTLSVRTRFEVFKRDRFTCRYCGQTPPQVLLEVDHILPRAAGGGDETENLVTSCQDCNRGKSDKLLTEGAVAGVGPDQIDEMTERLEQARQYMDLVIAERRLLEHQVGLVIDAWAETYGAALVDQEGEQVWTFYEFGRFPETRSIKTILLRLPLASVLQAVDRTAGRFRNPTSSACHYFYGVCWSMIRERDR